MDGYSLLYSSTHRTELLGRFQRLRSDGKMCDVVLETDGASFPCHRALLASSSDYFWALFGEATAERLARSIRLPALTPKGLDAILDFLYSGWLRVTPATLPDILEAARYLQVDTAVAICERYITDGLSVENCCSYANLAEHHALPDVLDAANYTIAAEMAKLMQERRDELLGLNVQSLMAVLDADEIPAVKEVDLVKLALDWLNDNGPLPPLQSNLLLSRLRFGLVAPSDLAHLGHAHRAMATPLIRSQVTRAQEYHGTGSAGPIRQNKQSTLRAPPDRVLLVGGGPGPDRPEQQVLTFNLKTRKFTSLTSCLPLKLRNHCVCSLGGFLFVVGGEVVSEADEKPITVETSNQVWRYDPRFESWQKVEPMLQRRAKFACCAMEDVIYAIGGQNADSNVTASLASVEFYDMAAGAWRRCVPMPSPLHGHACAVLDHDIYVSGGLSGNGIMIPGQSQSSKEVLCWDGMGGAWKKRAPMSIGRFSHRLATAQGYIYALLGMYEPFCEIERYDPREDHWTRLRPLLAATFNYGMAATPSGSLVVFGGTKWSNAREVAVKSVLEYDPKKDQWREIAQLPRPLTGTECTILPMPD
ncbi:kelch-like protein 34 [Nerophis lumbriciformis]|uniref:kelch-like protein 34 n=1 Tax=Nerophis lumbriciformis TaxID=546530 RepID=UPI002ADFBA63|nr:kelch-like protein 34 [Nerophis lumbriciformis]